MLGVFVADAAEPPARFGLGEGGAAEAASEGIAAARAHVMAFYQTPMARRILVVDDDPAFREVLIQRLRQREYDVYGAETGREGLDRLLDEKFDLLLLDLIMPPPTGLDILRALPLLDEPPICIIVSGVGDVWAERQSEFKPLAVLQKPVDFQMLLAMIESAFR